MLLVHFKNPLLLACKTGLASVEVCCWSLFVHLGTCCSSLLSFGLGTELSIDPLNSHHPDIASLQVVPLFPLIVVLSALNQVGVNFTCEELWSVSTHDTLVQAVRCVRGHKDGRCLTDRVHTMFVQMVHWEWVSLASWAGDSGKVTELYRTVALCFGESQARLDTRHT